MCEKHKDLNEENTRRNFLKKAMLLTGGSLFLSQIPVQAFAKNPLLNIPVEKGNNILILIQLKGGNDGLNTIVPFYDFGYYKSKRPKLHIPKSELIKLNNDFAIPESMKPLKSLWDKGMMKVVNSVGYPNPNLSHFHSEDVWSSGNDSKKEFGTGWLGRYLSQEFPNHQTAPPEIPVAIQVGGEMDLLFQSDQGYLGFSIEDYKELIEVAKTGEKFDHLNDNSKYGKELQYLRAVSNSTIHYSKAIQKAASQAKTETHYEPDELSQKFKLTAQFIKGNLGTKIYLVTLDGFDTHANQEWKHQDLLKQLSNAVHSFYSDLSKSKLQNKVLTMTYSEFGRRIEENGSRGTDHGTAAPVLFFGGGLEGYGCIGEPSDLRNPDEDGNLNFKTDFRSVYSTVLKNWMGANETMIKKGINGNFEIINGLI